MRRAGGGEEERCAAAVTRAARSLSLVGGSPWVTACTGELVAVRARLLDAQPAAALGIGEDCVSSVLATRRSLLSDRREHISMPLHSVLCILAIRCWRHRWHSLVSPLGHSPT
jgi:hypothetical protein